ncbi:CopD family protein [Exiguobacterium antarcticum]|uniref:CopD family protein n=1 Tax=Exiguobacterium antarcticum TaxID=132920 RepID=A0ABT6R5Z0_9BACL|nr:CopD family protein [Exiguobacterium antarcticum]MDI3236375.1 CopD family protein [Exiguobacterium antarcticum]
MSGLVSELLIYLGGALWAGRLVLLFVTDDKKPTLGVLDGVACVALISIVTGAGFPLWRVFSYFHHELELSIREAIRASLFEVRIGQYFLMVYFSALMAIIIVFMKRILLIKRWLLLGVTVPLFLGISGTSHAAAKHGLLGLILQTSHFSLMAFWVGIVFVIGWCARDANRWSSFLRWFSPFAQLTFLGVIVTGFFLMRQSVPLSEYRNAWNVPYGQALLWKHLLLIPVLGYAFINGTLVKRRLQKEPDFDPRRGLRFESLILCCVFLATAALSNLEPPDLQTLGEVTPILWSNIVLLLTGGGSIGLLLLTYQKRLPFLLGSLFCLLGVSLLYIGLVYTL